LVLNALGVLGSCYLVLVMLTALHVVCPWCALSHLLNFVMLWLSWKLWPRSDPAPGETPRPGKRLGIAGLLLMIAVAGLGLQRLAAAQMRTMTDQANRYAQGFYDDVDLQRYLTLRGPAVDIPIRPDDPVRGNPAAPHTVVVFSDLQCPACRSFAAIFESQVLPLAGDRLKLVYKHYPLNRTCNPWVSRNVHLHACEAAEVAEAAREEGGSEAFWRAHDALFRDQQALEDRPVSAMVAASGIDAARFATGTGSAARHDRILEDVTLGHRLNVDHTPTVYFDGHPLQGWNRVEVWKALVPLTP
jgi:protein-disulfide isomerase